jgi:hypothetical protein
MTTGTEPQSLGLAACVEIAERMALELAKSLRWLVTHPGSGAMLVIEGFVRDGELVLVADMPRQRAAARRALLSFALPLTPDPVSPQQPSAVPAPPRPSPAPARASSHGWHGKIA